MRCTLECVSRWQIGWLLTAILMIPVLIYLSTVVLKTPVKTTRPAVDKIGRQKLESDGLETHSRTIESPQVETHQAEPVKKCDDDSSVEHSSSVSDHTLSVKEQMHGSTTLHNTILTTSFGELTDMVSGLQNDKLKLQKLVITQKTVMDSEGNLNYSQDDHQLGLKMLTTSMPGSQPLKISRRFTWPPYPAIYVDCTVRFMACSAH